MQVTRCGTVKYKPIIDRVDVSVQTQVLDKIKALKLEKNNLSQADNTPKTESYFKSPIAPLDGQTQLISSIPDLNLIIACRRISSQRDQKLYEALCYYRILGQFEPANDLFVRLCEGFPTDVELRIENIKFLRHALERNFEANRADTPFQEVTQML